MENSTERICSNRPAGRRTRAMIVSMSRRVTIAAVAVAAVAVPTTALAVAKDRPSPGCMVISVTESAPMYTSRYDETGTVTVTTRTKCRGKITTTRTYKIVVRELDTSNGYTGR
jgi:hypothetical protein